MADQAAIPATPAARAAATRTLLANASPDAIAQAVADGQQFFCPETGRVITAKNVRALRSRLWHAAPPKGPRGDVARARMALYSALIAALSPPVVNSQPKATLTAKVAGERA
jgi:hypothetical protein